jgi:hypothetical protein
VRSLRSLALNYAHHLTALRADFPRPLASAAPCAPGGELSWRWYLALFALCFVPRLGMACKIDILCPDAIVYINLASALERGDWATGLEQMRLNVFPLVLMLLHRLGLDWQLAGEAWNVCLASAAVIPLLSWVQRMFDGRTALVAAFLYAVHPSLIERSPEVIRDPTFWFAMFWSLDASWRAVTQVRVRDFVMAGAAVALAVLTRFEGLFLYVPLVAWTALRLPALATGRARLLVGLGLALGILPAGLLVVQQVCFPTVNPVSLVRIEPLLRVASCFEPATNIELHAPQRPASLLALLPKYVQSVVRGVDPLMLALIAFGIAGWTFVWRRREHWPLHALAALFLLGGWFHLWYSQTISCRYSLPVFLLASPWGALGLAWPASRLAALPRAFQQVRIRALATSAILVVVLLAGWSDALTSRLSDRRELVEISHDIATRIGPEATVFAQGDALMQVRFYAGIDCVSLDRQLDLAGAIDRADPSRPVVVLLDRKRGDFGASLQIACDTLGIGPVDPAARSGGHWLVLTRPARQARARHVAPQR